MDEIFPADEMSLHRCRELLGDEAIDLCDEEIERIRRCADAVAQAVIETGLAERDRMVHGAAGPTDPVPSHHAVVEAIRRRNPTQAARAMGKLLDQAIEDVARLEGMQREDRQD